MKNRVRGYRNMLGLTLKQLGDELDITPQSLSAKERSVRNFTDKEKIYLLERFREIEPDLDLETLFFSR